MENIMVNKKILFLLTFCPLMLFAEQNLLLDFSGAVATYNEETDSLEIRVEDAASGVDVLIQSVNSYVPHTVEKGLKKKRESGRNKRLTNPFKIWAEHNIFYRTLRQ